MTKDYSQSTELYVEANSATGVCVTSGSTTVYTPYQYYQPDYCTCNICPCCGKVRNPQGVVNPQNTFPNAVWTTPNTVWTSTTIGLCGTNTTLTVD